MQNNDIPLDQLAIQAKTDERALEQLLARLDRDIEVISSRYIYKCTREDIRSALIIAVWQSIKDYKPEYTFATFFAAVVRHTMYKLRRPYKGKAFNDQMLSSNFQSSSEEDMPQDLCNPTVQPKPFTDEYFIERTHQMLARVLSDKYLDYAHLHYAYGMLPREIARIRNDNPKNISQVIRVATQRLRAALDKETGEILPAHKQCIA